ncbi:MAG: hypothetical protein M1834_000539 [Cirrosporium novae-zelandiae]|nr:MAG: hypothetical protein M1834_000539 [Cirrosporium novae-zelandiae]
MADCDNTEIVVDNQARKSQVGKRSRTPRACARCKRQRLKCDIQRPCMTCRRAGAKCENVQINRWRHQYGKESAHYVSQNVSTSPCQQKTPATRKGAGLETPEASQPEHELSKTPKPSSIDVNHEHTPSCEGSRSRTPQNIEHLEPSSSTLEFVKEARLPIPPLAFHFHSSDALDTSPTSALPGGRVYTPMLRRSRHLPTAKLIAVLPTHKATSLLVDTYFDRVHWFMLVFHQTAFRAKFGALFSTGSYQGTDGDGDFGFVCSVLTVVTLGLQYTCPYRKKILSDLNIDTDLLMEQLLSTLRSVVFDLVSVGSLESAQVCILLGSFYLYHGDPGPAWPIIGCALRIAQALRLHRRQDIFSNLSTSQEVAEQTSEEKKRCWWALFEIDCFCSMVYGYPLNVSKRNCDVDLLDPFAKPGSERGKSQADQAPREPTLLSYKFHMSELSLILTDILSELYSPSHGTLIFTRNLSRKDGYVQDLVAKVAHLDGRLKQWRSTIHPKMLLEDSLMIGAAYSSTDQMHADIGASGPVFERHVMRMQAMTLTLAYENALIVTHRPLLSFRLAQPSISSDITRQITPMFRAADPFRYSLETCRQAAFQTANISRLPVFHEALDTYAIAFVGIHLFTAGVTLCLMASYEPLTLQAHEAKAGIRRILTMQAALRSKSVLVSQGFDILRKLAKLVFSKELEKMLDVEDLESDELPGIDSVNSRAQVLENPSVADQSGVSTHQLQDDLLSESRNPAHLDNINTDNQSSFNLGPIFGSTVDLNFVQDETMMQSLFDIDRVLSYRPPTDSLNESGWPENEHFLSLDSASASVSADQEQEQAWIWNSGLFPGGGS